MCINVYYIKFEFPYTVTHKSLIPQFLTRATLVSKDVYSGDERLVIKLWLTCTK